MVTGTNNNTDKFGGHTKLHDLISTNYTSLLIMTRFGIPLGVGDSTIEEVCRKNGVDMPTLLMVLRIASSDIIVASKDDIKKIDLDCLLSYLTNSHSYFLEFRLPKIRQQLIEAISDCPKDIFLVIERFFDEYVDEVRKHMSYEDQIVFPYARKLHNGEKTHDYKIDIFSKSHDQIELKISELKNILIKYYPGPSGHELMSTLHDIFACEEDLASHNRVEDYVFIPYIKLLEKSLAHKK